MVDAEALVSQVRVGSISPVPDDDVIAAVTVAVLEAWPKPSAAMAPEPADERWRFSQRRWRDRSVPRRAWGG